MIRVMHGKTAASISSELFAYEAKALAISFVTTTKGKGEITALFQPGFAPVCAAQPVPLCTKRCERTKEDEPSNRNTGHSKASPFI